MIAAKDGRDAAGTGSSNGVRRPAGRALVDVVVTFIEGIIAGDPGHPLSRVPFF